MLLTQIDVQWQMRSTATRCFFNASRVCRSVLITPTFVSPHKIAARSESTHVRATKRFGPRRCDPSIESIRASQSSQQRNYSATKPNVSFELDRLVSPKRPPRWRNDSFHWRRLLEPYLPHSLRNDSRSCKSEGIKPIRGVSAILSRARRSDYGGLDLLSYLGVGQKRWKAVIWLIKSMSSSYLEYSTAKEEQEGSRAPSWKLDSLDLEMLTTEPIWADDIIQPLSGKISLENSRDENKVLMGGYEINVDREVMGQIWQSTASMILQAADNPLGDTKSNIIMSHVFEILAHLHHINAFPPSIYDYSPPADPFVPHKPPTLSLLSSQIMAILSDTAWRVQEYELSTELEWDEMVKSERVNKRHGSMADPDFHVPGLSHGIWLDLVLWACVEGGWISEAAWIVSAINSRKNDPNFSWSVIRWDSIQQQMIPETDWKIRLRLESQLFGVHQLAGGIPKPGEGMQFHSINIPPRTLSYEVIAVLIDGLIINAPNIRNRVNAIRRTQKSICLCKNLLETDGHKSDPQVVNSALLRLVGTEGSAITRTPELLEEILCLAYGEARTFPLPNLVSASADQDFTTDSAIILGLIHQLLYCFARLDFVHGALRSFQMAQEVVDIYSQQRLKDFLEKSKSPLLLMGNLLGSEDEIEHLNEETSKIEILAPFEFRLPGYVLVAFLEFVTRAELWELGKWLFYSDDIDGPTIPSKIYSRPYLQPAVLRFATATADSQLLVKVTEKLNAPLSQSVLRALLHCQAAVGKWDSVRDLLSYFRDEPEMQWDASDAMSIATSIVRMERSIQRSDSSKLEDISLAFGILQSLISGEFNSAHSRARFSDLPQLQLTIQIDRILRRIPGKLSTLKSQYSAVTGRSYAPVDISVEAFNMLMKCIVDCHGSIAGKALWDMWCQEFWLLPTSYSVPHVENAKLEQVIKPNIQTLRIILLPLMRSYIITEDISTQANESILKKENLKLPETKAQKLPSILDFDLAANVPEKASLLSEPEQEILQWGIAMYRKFGITEKHLRAEVATHLLRWQMADKWAAISQEQAVQFEARLTS